MTRDETGRSAGDTDHGRTRFHTATQLILLAFMALGLLVFVGGIIWLSLHVPAFIEVVIHE